ncbi:MAG: hypothetical protein PHC58_00405 [Candidatus Omnitrophica bacterium]|nr:hypothetical protein [Candidatus Omnitrophota bacterium]
MKIICGVGLDSDAVFVSFGGITNNKISLIAERKILFGDVLYDKDLNSSWDKLVSCVDAIEDIIISEEKKYCTKIKDICFVLPRDACRIIYASKSCVFKSVKNVSVKDIKDLKKSLENEKLQWDEAAIAHFVHSFEADGNSYPKVQAGLWAKKIVINSEIFSVKTNIYEKAIQIMDSMGRRLVSIVPYEYAVFSSFYPYGFKENNTIVVYIGYTDTNFIFFERNMVKSSGSVPLGVMGVIDAISEEFSINKDIAAEIFSLYVNFDEKRYASAKNISVKNGDYFVTVNMDVVNKFVCDFIKRSIDNMLADNVIGRMASENVKVAFMGRFFEKTSARDFFLGNFNDFVSPVFNNISLSFGGILFHVYSLSVVKNGYKMIWHKLINIYKEYF